ncbi:hypothetical protein ACSV5M_03975 [Cellvibrio sp. ARAG 10.3]|uniref:hypothetical protein n=1 Tax=Cellvibrio sp. ARAG 10.3 TaxID=3451358 RepID=UPI003F479B8E
MAVAKQLIKVREGGKVWLGSESVNLLQILNDLIQAVDVANTASLHTHPYTDNGSPMNTQALNQNSAFSSEKELGVTLKLRLDPIIVI